MPSLGPLLHIDVRARYNVTQDLRKPDACHCAVWHASGAKAWAAPSWHGSACRMRLAMHKHTADARQAMADMLPAAARQHAAHPWRVSILGAPAAVPACPHYGMHRQLCNAAGRAGSMLTSLTPPPYTAPSPLIPPPTHTHTHTHHAPCLPPCSLTAAPCQASRRCSRHQTATCGRCSSTRTRCPPP
jgi:hypothetical protein